MSINCCNCVLHGVFNCSFFLQFVQLFDVPFIAHYETVQKYGAIKSIHTRETRHFNGSNSFI